MPVFVKDFTWRQSESVIIIHVPLKGVHHSKVDVFMLDDYLKAHYAPFIFEIFLFAPVKDAESICTKSDGEIVFELTKVEEVLWMSLEAKLTKEEKNICRVQNIERSHQKTEAERKEKADKQSELHRLAVKKQIALDAVRIKKIKDMKEHEKKTAMKDLEAWKNFQSNQIFTVEDATKPFAENQVPPLQSCSDKSQQKKKSTNPIKKVSEFLSNIRKKEGIPIPATRSTGFIKVCFTPRDFPTPSRESQHPLEEEWLKKQAEARRQSGFVVEDLSPEELDPVWLKEKGDYFFKVGNHLGAISAYSHAIKLGSKLPSLFSNRSASHMALGNLHRVIEDCSRALELLTPHVSLNADARARCHVRRGTALCRLGLAKHGADDLEEAVKLQPHNKELKEDYEKARILAEQEDSDTDFDDM